VMAAPCADNRKIRVAIVAPSLRYVGGQAVQADLLVHCWQDDPDVQASFIPVDPTFPRFLSKAAIVPCLRTLVRMPLYWLALYRGLAKADVAHVFSASYSSFLLAPVPAQIISRLRRKKVIINYHSGEAADHLKRSKIAVRLLSRADDRVVPSGYLVRVFGDFGLKTHVVPNMIDSSQFRYRTRWPLRPRLLCSRGFHPYYRVDLVVRAFREIKDVFPDAVLCLPGVGPQENEVRNLVRKFNLADVEFPGAVDRTTIGAWFDRTDIFINASALDNMPVSILEAFAAGTPVVSTAPEGIRYMVTHEYTGLLSEPGDWRALADNVLRLLRDPELALRLARNGLEESKGYLWSAVRPRWLEIYRSMVKESTQRFP
jgi:L-malate glycosyltransferase